MKILCTGDWHISSVPPKARTDNFVQTQMDKIEWIFDLASSEGCYYIIQPGDLTEHFPYPKMPYELTQQYIRLFKSAFYNLGIRMLTIFGQHDMNNHSNRTNTPLFTIEAARAVHILTPEYMIFKVPNDLSQIAIHGLSYGETIDQLEPCDEPSILVLHKLLSDKDYWSGHVEYTSASQFLKKLEKRFDLVVVGDNHKSFYMKEGGSYLVNCGALMRTAIDQRYHEPMVFIYNTEMKTLHRFKVPTESFDSVFNLEEAKREKENEDKKEEMAILVEKLAGDKEISGLDFVKNLRDVLHQQGDPNLIAIAEETLK
jgi:DNA repair exonuclease SbcCD nuclease subunit